MRGLSERCTFGRVPPVKTRFAEEPTATLDVVYWSGAAACASPHLSGWTSPIGSLRSRPRRAGLAQRAWRSTPSPWPATPTTNPSLLRGRTEELCVWCFDLLKLNGRDLRYLPLERRKARLGSLLVKTDDARLRLSHTFDDGEQLLYARLGRAWRASSAKSARLPMSRAARRAGLRSRRRSGGLRTVSDTRTVGPLGLTA